MGDGDRCAVRASGAQFRSVGLSLALLLPRDGFFPFSFSFFSFLERSPAPGVWNQLDKLLSYGGGEGEGVSGREARGGEGRGEDRRGGRSAAAWGLGQGHPRAGARVPSLETLPNFGRTLERI